MAESADAVLYKHVRMAPLRHKTERPRGIVHGPGQGQANGEPVRLLRLEPPAELAPYVEHFWVVRWSLPAGQTLEQATLPHPVVHWTVEGTRSELLGVTRGRFVRRLSGSGRVVAAKFRPAGLCAFTREPLHTLTDREVPASRLLGAKVGRALRGLDALGEEEAVERLSAALSSLEMTPDPAADEARRIVEHIAGNREVTAVETAARWAGFTVLALQRLFRAKVGVSPKWVIQRYRMHEALERLATGALSRSGTPGFAELALELGFTDQAHFCRVFKQFVGESPAAYADRVRLERTKGS
ncbi:helix-turn-helix transcriptional regulator [Archangium minus]|uniref:Helix-turn-helix transcriptional regulator n=1 Tax=Archangium minus TaxID=83450 RepID=A0ABY9WJT8_9BACT|nr:helix-turn-helix transcriptional regulator [Archangium minus]